MFIESIKIKGFGKFKDLKLDFKSSMNYISGPLESGKSTIQSFIKAMLYGFNDENFKGGIDDFEKYEPWDDSDFGGSICLRTTLDKSYTIHRDFKNNNFKVFENDSTDISPAFAKNPKPIGEIMLGMSVDEFEKAIFIHRQELRMATDFGGSLNEELHNFLTTGYPDVSLKKSLAALDVLTDEIAGKNGGKPNLLIDIDSRISDAQIRGNGIYKIRKKIETEEKLLEEAKKNKSIMQDKMFIQKAISYCGRLQESTASKVAARDDLAEMLGEIAIISTDLSASNNTAIMIKKTLDSATEYDSSLENVFSDYEKYNFLSTQKADVETKISAVENEISKLKEGYSPAVNVEYISDKKNLETLESSVKTLELLESKSKGQIIGKKPFSLLIPILLYVLSAIFILAPASLFIASIYYTGNVLQINNFIGMFKSLTGVVAYISLGLSVIISIILCIFAIRLTSKRRKAKESFSKSKDAAADDQATIEGFKNVIMGILSTAGVKDYDSFVADMNHYKKSGNTISQKLEELRTLNGNYMKIHDEQLVTYDRMRVILSAFDILEPDEGNITDSDIEKYKNTIGSLSDTRATYDKTVADIAEKEVDLTELKTKVCELAKIEKFDSAKITTAQQELNQEIGKLNDLMVISKNKLQAILGNFQNENYLDVQRLAGRILEGESLNLKYIDEVGRALSEKESETIEEVKGREETLASLRHEEILLSKTFNEEAYLKSRKDFLGNSVYAVNVAKNILSETSKAMEEKYSPLMSEDMTLDQMFIAMRIAKSDTQDLPIVIDEVFEQYKSTRVNDTFKYLSTNCKDRQILYFSAEDSHLPLAKKVFSGNFNLIKL